MSIHVPESFETARLLIRAPQPGDGAEVNAAVRETFAQLRPWMPWADHLPSVADSEHNIREAVGGVSGAHRPAPEPLPEGDGRIRGRKRAAPHRLERAEVRDRLLAALRV